MGTGFDKSVTGLLIGLRGNVIRDMACDNLQLLHCQVTAGYAIANRLVDGIVPLAFLHDSGEALGQEGVLSVEKARLSRIDHSNNIF